MGKEEGIEEIAQLARSMFARKDVLRVDPDLLPVRAAKHCQTISCAVRQSWRNSCLAQVIVTMIKMTILAMIVGLMNAANTRRFRKAANPPRMFAS